MEPPRINPVGLLETPADLDTAPRRFSRPLRLLAGLLLVLFLLGTMVTTVVSLGRYCLTTDSTDTRDLPSKGER
ncbi:MAG: hypothetical protein ACJ76N_24145 [Thermoanaerobaculia bacterium]